MLAMIRDKLDNVRVGEFQDVYAHNRWHLLCLRGMNYLGQGQFDSEVFKEFNRVGLCIL
jgi:hypothetical protein